MKDTAPNDGRHPDDGSHGQMDPAESEMAKGQMCCNSTGSICQCPNDDGHECDCRGCYY